MSVPLTVCPAHTAVAVEAIDSTCAAMAMARLVRLLLAALLCDVTIPLPPHPPPLRPERIKPVMPV